MNVTSPMLVILGSLTLPSPVSAASVTVSDTSTDLPGAALDTTAILIDAGLHPHNMGGGKFMVEAKGFHCDRRSNAPVDAADPHAGVPNLKCRVNAKNEKDTKSGKPFAEAHAMTDLLQKVQNSTNNGGVAFDDCAAGGYCGTFARLIGCTIDTMIDNLNNGARWSCTFTDGQ
jgi:hypothetical protein